MMNFFLINLLTLLLFRSSSISCIGSRNLNILSALPLGPYKLNFKQVRSCDPSKTYKIQHNFYLSNNQISNATEIRGTTIGIVPFDDTLFMEGNVAFRGADGNWKDNTYIHKSPKACSSFRNLMGAEWTTVMNGLGIKNATCPIPPGQYKLIFKQFKSCGISQHNEMQFNIYLSSHNPKSDTTEIKGNVTTSRPLDDTFSLEVNFTFKDADGHWKENTYIHKSPNGCSSMRNLLGTEWTKIMNGFGMNATCPILPGIYMVPGLDTSVFINTNIPKTFIYGTYKVRIFFSRFNEVYGCNIFVLEFKF